jgi:hypothetical protein
MESLEINQGESWRREEPMKRQRAVTAEDATRTRREMEGESD